MKKKQGLRGAVEQSLAELIVAKSLLTVAGTDPIAWLDGIERRLREALETGANAMLDRGE